MDRQTISAANPEVNQSLSAAQAAETNGPVV